MGNKNKKEKDISLQEIVEVLAMAGTNVVEEKERTQIVDSFGEVIINGLTYQIQMVLEPRESFFVDTKRGIAARTMGEYKG